MTMPFYDSNILRYAYFALYNTVRKSYTSELKTLLAKKIPKHQQKVMEFRKEHGLSIVQQTTVNQVYEGLRGIFSLICEPSVVDPDEGVRFRGYSISECQKLLPKAKTGTSPLPEGMFWLLITGDIPTESQVAAVSAEWADRAAIPQHVATMVKNFPHTLHPMTQFGAAITALSSESHFARACADGTKKQPLWEHAYEDAMDLIAKLPVLAAKVFINSFRDGKGNFVIDPKKDWSHNMAQMMGYDNNEFVDFLRLYLAIHSDNEGGNVSSHTVHIVSSALSDPYISLAAGMNGLAGPLHGLASQNALIFITRILNELGDKTTDDQIKDFCFKTLKGGQVIPGFGHAVLRKPDPRYECQRDFAQRNFPDDPLFKISLQLMKIVPPMLQELGQVQSPWPNVDANSGVCLHHYGLTEIKFNTVLFGVSRALGTMSSLVWSRALDLPLQRPRSISTDKLIELIKKS